LVLAFALTLTTSSEAAKARRYLITHFGDVIGDRSAYLTVVAARGDQPAVQKLARAGKLSPRRWLTIEDGPEPTAVLDGRRYTLAWLQGGAVRLEDRAGGVHKRVYALHHQVIRDENGGTEDRTVPMEDWLREEGVASLDEWRAKFLRENLAQAEAGLTSRNPQARTLARDLQRWLPEAADKRVADLSGQPVVTVRIWHPSILDLSPPAKP